MKPILLDTNLLIYFVSNNEPEKHAMAKRLLDDANAFPGKYVLAMQNMREFANVAVGKLLVPSEKIQEALIGFRGVFGEGLVESFVDMEDGVRWAQERNVPFYDALLAATALRHGVTTIYTENTKDFEKIPGIKAMNPLK